MFHAFGVFTGKLHALSSTFMPKSHRRHTWRENYYLNHVKTFIPDKKVRIHQAHSTLMEALDTLHGQMPGHDLIHGDLNVGNFHVENGNLTVFDFDACQYSWFVEDIAIALYYTLFVYGDDDRATRDAMGATFMDHFLRGYRQH
ncbi:MAG: hypothetical protein EA374_08230 [Acholeplasmatales bacterium]|nr:MAG: hypothetical protein EA374_08230 [Acholeplasmatales bacterium]